MDTNPLKMCAIDNWFPLVLKVIQWPCGQKCRKCIIHLFRGFESRRNRFFSFLFGKMVHLNTIDVYMSTIYFYEFTNLVCFNVGVMEMHLFFQIGDASQKLRPFEKIQGLRCFHLNVYRFISVPCLGLSLVFPFCGVAVKR